MKNISRFTTIAMASLSLASVSFAADAVSHGDKEFLKDAGELGMTEVALGNLAVERATTPALKELGARLVADHTKSNEELVTLAQQKGVEMTLQPNAAQKTMLEAFKAKTGAEFDKELMEHVRKDHEKAIDKFTKAAEASKDMDVKAFALRNVGVMQQHHLMSTGGTAMPAH